MFKFASSHCQTEPAQRTLWSMDFRMPTHSPGCSEYFYSLNILDHPYTLICDITWESRENYIKHRFEFVFTVERKMLKEFLGLQKSRSGSFLTGGIRPAHLF